MKRRQVLNSLFDKRLAAHSDVLGVPVAWENTKFTMPTDSVFLATRMQIGGARASSLGPDPLIRIDGVYEISVVTRVGQGWGASARLLDLLNDVFPHGLVLSGEGITVTITETSTTAGFEHGKEFWTPLVVRFWAHAL